MKKKLILIGIIVSTIVLAVLSVVTALKIKQLGTQPIAPSAPKTKPKAVEPEIPEIPPSEACRQTFLVALGPSPTPTPYLKAEANCIWSDGSNSSPHVDVVVTGRIIPPSTDGVWGTVTDESSNKTVVYLYGDRYQQPNITWHGVIDSIRGQESLIIQSDNRTYTVKVYYAPFTSGTPTLTNPVIQTTFKVDCDFSVTPTPTPTGTLTPTPTSTLTPGPTATGTPGPSPTPTSTLTPGPTVTGTPGPTNTPGPSPTPTSTPKPGVTTALVATPTEIQLPEAGLKLPTLWGIIVGFLLISLGAALVF